MTNRFVDKIIEVYNRLKYTSWYYSLLLKYGIGNKDSNCAIVMFHHILDNYSNEILDSCQCTLDEFCEFCEFVSKEYNVVSIRDFVQQVNNEKNRLLVVSFDDVPNTFYTNAYPILKKYKIPFVLYISNSFLDTEGYLTSAQIKQLSIDPLCTIGAHTRNHQFLKYCLDLQDEIVTSKEELEKIINKEIRDFAYPYGTPTAINNSVIKFVEKSKSFDTAVTTIPVLVNSNIIKNQFALPRIQSKLFMSKYKNK